MCGDTKPCKEGLGLTETIDAHPPRIPGRDSRPWYWFTLRDGEVPCIGSHRRRQLFEEQIGWDLRILERKACLDNAGHASRALGVIRDCLDRSNQHPRGGDVVTCGTWEEGRAEG